MQSVNLNFWMNGSIDGTVVGQRDMAISTCGSSLSHILDEWVKTPVERGYLLLVYLESIYLGYDACTNWREP